MKELQDIAREYARHSSELRKTSFYGVSRHISLSLLSRYYAVTNQLLFANKNRVQFLSLHHLFPDEEKAFDLLLAALMREHTFITYSEAVERVVSGHIDRPYIAFSFDDGIKNCLRAVRIMNKYGAKACFFVCPHIIGKDDPSVVGKFCVQNLRIPPVELMSWADLEFIVGSGHEVGSHTMEHHNLTELPQEQGLMEISKSFEILCSRLGSIKHFAWPFGRFTDFNESAQRAVFESGYRSCASGERGCHTVSANGIHEELCIRRDHVIPSWPVHHVMFFLSRNYKTSSYATNQWPYDVQDGRFRKSSH
jgi:peptidoglycan/xylan/chitin deacetylase (PgdA/CDA1 family)